MFNLQGSEIIFILLIALVVLGPEKLPSAIKRAMNLYNELRKLSSGFQEEFKSVIDEPMREMKSTADLVKNAADPKRMAEEAEREAETKAAADKKERQARKETSAMEAAGAAHLAKSAAEPTAEIEPAGDAFADPVDVAQDDEQDPVKDSEIVGGAGGDAGDGQSGEMATSPRLASVDLDVESGDESVADFDDESRTDSGDEPDDEAEEKSA